MDIESQSAALEFLTSASTHGLASSDITVIRTHISIIVLAGSVAYKLKRAVCLPYVDFSTPERRIQACFRELSLNRRTALGERQLRFAQSMRRLPMQFSTTLPIVLESSRVQRRREFHLQASGLRLRPPLYWPG